MATISNNRYGPYGSLTSYAVFIMNILACFLCIGGPSSTFLAQSSDTIKPNETLRFPDKRLSADGVFTLGFFSLEVDSEYWYLGIWYTNNDDYNQKVWVGNRYNPISIANGNLTLDGDGILKIMNGNETPIMLNSADRAAKNSSATLQNSGNFVLSDDGSTTKRVLWESFDDPVDTLLPGMKLGVNFKTGRNWSLTSWLTEQLPTPGPFSLEWDWKATELVMRRRGEIYWTSGILDKQDKSFPNIPWLGNDSYNNNDYNFGYVSNKSESSYFYYSSATKRVSWWNLAFDGKLFDANGLVLVVADACYGYNNVSGCVEQNSAECRAVAAGGRDSFLLKKGIFRDPKNVWYDQNNSSSLSDCWAMCWKNCSCIAYSTNNAQTGTGCIFWNTSSNFEISDSSSWEVYVLNSTLSIDGNTSKAGDNGDGNN